MVQDDEYFVLIDDFQTVSLSVSAAPKRMHIKNNQLEEEKTIHILQCETWIQYPEFPPAWVGDNYFEIEYLGK